MNLYSSVQQLISYNLICQNERAKGDNLCYVCRGNVTRLAAFLDKWHASKRVVVELDPLKQPTCFFCANCRKIFAEKRKCCNIESMRIETDSIERDKQGIVVGCRVAQYPLLVAGRPWKQSA